MAKNNPSKPMTPAYEQEMIRYARRVVDVAEVIANGTEDGILPDIQKGQVRVLRRMVDAHTKRTNGDSYETGDQYLMGITQENMMKGNYQRRFTSMMKLIGGMYLNSLKKANRLAA